MLIFVDAPLFPDALAFSDACEPLLAKHFGLSPAQIHQHVPIPQQEGDYPITGKFTHSPLATVLDFCARTRAAMDLIESEDLGDLHIFAGGLDSALATMGVPEDNRYTKLYNDTLRLQPAAHIHLLYPLEDTPELLGYGEEKVIMARETLYLRGKMPNRAPTLQLMTNPWDSASGELTPQALSTVTDFFDSSIKRGGAV
jgi:hypothetical protein